MNLDDFKTKFSMLNNESKISPQLPIDADDLNAKLLFNTFKSTMKKDLKEAVIQYKKTTPTNKQLETEIDALLTDIFKDKASLTLIVQLGTKEFITYLMLSNNI